LARAAAVSPAPTTAFVLAPLVFLRLDRGQDGARSSQALNVWLRG
jgi:hypothetical protein